MMHVKRKYFWKYSLFLVIAQIWTNYVLSDTILVSVAYSFQFQIAPQFLNYLSLDDLDGDIESIEANLKLFLKLEAILGGFVCNWFWAVDRLSLVAQSLFHLFQMLY